MLMVTPFHLSDGKLRVEARSYGADYFSKEKSESRTRFVSPNRPVRSFPNDQVGCVTCYYAFVIRCNSII